MTCLNKSDETLMRCHQVYSIFIKLCEKEKKMKNERIIFSNKDNIIKTFSLFLKYRKSVIGINICIVILILLGQIAATYFPGWIVDLVTFYTSEAVIWNKVIPVILFLGSIDLLIDLLNHKKVG